jgi:hypothetical protein
VVSVVVDPAPVTYAPRDLTVAGDVLYFVAVSRQPARPLEVLYRARTPGRPPEEIWADTSVPLTTLQSPSDLTPHGSKVYFLANASNAGVECWESGPDGTRRLGLVLQPQGASYQRLERFHSAGTRVVLPLAGAVHGTFEPGVAGSGTAVARVVGTPCGDGTGATLAAAGPPRLGDPFRLLLRGAPANHLGFLTLALGPGGTFQFYGCPVHGDPGSLFVFHAFATGAGGGRDVTLPLPDDAALTGQDFRMWAAYGDLQGRFTGANGLQVVPGRR